MATPVTLLNCRFQVQISGIAVSDFDEVILPDGRAEIAEYREGNEKTPQKAAGAVSYGNLILRRGVTASDNELYQWWQNVAGGTTDRRTVSVSLLDGQLNPVKTWQITNAWPARYAIGSLIAIDGNVTLMETLECAVEGFSAV
jgi:phage tail-like protein